MMISGQGNNCFPGSHVRQQQFSSFFPRTSTQIFHECAPYPHVGAFASSGIKNQNILQTTSRFPTSNSRCKDTCARRPTFWMRSKYEDIWRGSKVTCKHVFTAQLYFADVGFVFELYLATMLIFLRHSVCNMMIRTIHCALYWIRCCPCIPAPGPASLSSCGNLCFEVGDKGSFTCVRSWFLGRGAPTARGTATVPLCVFTTRPMKREPFWVTAVGFEDGNDNECE
jgi:hypothetical protein